jgi:hypothetical protein
VISSKQHLKGDNTAMLLSCELTEKNIQVQNKILMEIVVVVAAAAALGILTKAVTMKIVTIFCFLVLNIKKLVVTVRAAVVHFCGKTCENIVEKKKFLLDCVALK